MILLMLWVTSLSLSLGTAAIIFLLMNHVAKKPWDIKIDKNYKPKISIIVPTYNEAGVIWFKLENLVKIKYPNDLMQILIVDSNSEDETVTFIGKFARLYPDKHIQVLTQGRREGKTAALNYALEYCNGEVIIVSDADCFWPSDILENALPYLADFTVGAISGPKVLLNPNKAWVTRSEDAYLSSMNLMKLGESKIGSTLLFEGGFSAYKRHALTSFDPYNTGSDDCGTIIKLIEHGYRTLLVPEAKFYSAFPSSWKEKLSIKVRRANQLIRVFGRYARLLLTGRIKSSKRIVVQGVLLFIVGPITFALFVATTVALLLNFPFLILLLLPIFLVPKIGISVFEVVQNYLLLLFSMLMVAFNKNFVVWRKPRDRIFIQKKVLQDYKLI